MKQYGSKMLTYTRKSVGPSMLLKVTIFHSFNHNPKRYMDPGVHCSTVYTNQNIFSSVAQSCPTLCDPVNSSIPGLPVHH